jgi:hypothetical protein
MQTPSLVAANHASHASLNVRHAIAGLVAICLGVSAHQEARADTVYKCARSDGSTEFSAKPCAPDAKPVTVDGKSPYDHHRDAERVWHVTGEADAGTAAACLDAVWRPLLKDPESGTLTGTPIIVSSPRRIMLVSEGRARNSFGGMNVQYFVCDLDSKGLVYPADMRGDLNSLSERIKKWGIDFTFPGTSGKQ